jgi:hypothetical protein
MAEDNNVTAEVLARIAIAVTAEVVKSGTISNNATATTIIAAEVAAFASDPRYAEHRDLDVFYEERGIVAQISAECIFQLKLCDPNRAHEPAIRLVKSVR